MAAARQANAGSLFWTRWDFEQGLEEMRRALALDPNDARARAFYSHMLVILDRPEEAREQGDLAMQLDPLDPFVRGLHGTLLAGTAPPEEAIELLEALLEDHPGFGMGLGGLVVAYRRAGRPEDELRVLRTQCGVSGYEAAVAAIDRGLATGGNEEARKEAAEVLAAQFEERFVPALSIAILYMGAGDGEKALDWLERAVEQRDQNLPYMRLWGFESLYGNPRFHAVMEEIGVPLLGG